MYTGLTGAIKINPNFDESGSTPKTLAYISNWSIEDTMDVIEITELGSDSKKKKAGLQSWSASADGSVVFETESTRTTHNELFEAKHNRRKIQIELYLHDGTNGKDKVYFKGNGYIESLSVDLSAEDKGNISISVSGSGELLLYKEEYCTDSECDGEHGLFKTAVLLAGDAANLG